MNENKAAVLSEQEIQEIEAVTNEANRGPWRMWVMEVRGACAGNG